MASSIAGAFSDMASSGGLLSAFKAAFNGNTKAMAQALGVSQRSAQRYFTTGAQKRNPSKATRAKMARQVPIKVEFKGRLQLSNDKRNRAVSFEMSQRRVGEVAQQLARGQDDLAFENVWENYFIPDSAEGDYTFSPAR